ncbi:mechanosensitive ion channel family protein [Mycoplasmatota bacterium WC44]
MIEFLHNQDYMDKLTFSIISIIAVPLIVKLVNYLLFKLIKNNTKYHLLRKRNYYIFSMLLIIFNMILWIDSFDNLLTYFGLLSAGIAIALRDVFANIAAWLFILIRKPFEVSNRIMINGKTGDVIDIRLFQFSVMEISNYEEGEQSTGSILNIPNYYIFIHSLKNYNKGFEYLWNEINVVITFKSNWKKAKAILLEICEKHSLHLSDDATQKLLEAKKNYRIHYNHLKPIVYTDVKDNGVQLTMRYLCEPRNRRSTINDIWEDVLTDFENESEIELAYPTIKIHQD